MKFLEEGKTEEEIRTYMQKTYFASDEKIDLSIDIAERELEILKKIDYERLQSLYRNPILSDNPACNCSLHPTISELETESGQLSGCFGKRTGLCCSKIWKKHLNSIYIGGGTPTTLEPYQLDRLIRKIRCSFDLSHCLEFTVEAGRPDSITREKLETLKNGTSQEFPSIRRR